MPREINKTDATSLVSAFGSVRGAVNSRKEELATVQGWGEVKVQRWYKSVREPFRVEGTEKKVGGQIRALEAVSVGTLPPAVTKVSSGRQVDEEDVDFDMAVAESLRIAEEEANEMDELFVRQESTESAPIPRAGSKRRAEEPELSEGIAAALAKFRS